MYEITAELLQHHYPAEVDQIISGTIRNLTGDALAIGRGKEQPRLGVLVASLDDGLACAEARGFVATEVLPGGSSVSYRVVLPLRHLNPGRYQLRIDLVIEGLHWFIDAGISKPTIIELEIMPPEAYAIEEYGEAVAREIRKACRAEIALI